VEGRHRVEELRARPDGGQRRAQKIGDESVGVHRDVHHARLVRREAAQRADIGRTLGEHDIAWVAIDAGDQVQRHLQADGDDEVVRIDPDPSSAITSQICSRSSGGPAPSRTAGATCPSRATRSATSVACASIGSAAMLGILPASNTTSGLLATANSARISDAVIPAVRAASRSVAGGGSETRVATRALLCRLGNGDPIECHQDGGTSCPSS
jgi:hypothetical protein